MVHNLKQSTFSKTNNETNLKWEELKHEKNALQAQ